METLAAECREDQLIMMTEAQYGMMEKNRCVDPKDDLSKTYLHMVHQIEVFLSSIGSD